MSKQNGGPAFPTYDDVEYESGHALGQMTAGMTLRDWFAGTVLPGYLHSFDASLPDYAARVAAKAYAMADAMLSERDK